MATLARRTGFPLGLTRVYWFAIVKAPEGQQIPIADRREYLLDKFNGWPFQFSEIIACTAELQILQNDLVDRIPLSRWSKGRITLLGDAAHPATPNLGQGACLAIEDAMVLTRMIHEYQVPDAEFGHDERERLQRTSRIVRMSWAQGKMAGWENRLAVWTGESLGRLTPRILLDLEFRNQVEYDAGDLPGSHSQGQCSDS